MRFLVSIMSLSIEWCAVHLSDWRVERSCVCMQQYQLVNIFILHTSHDCFYWFYFNFNLNNFSTWLLCTKNTCDCRNNWEILTFNSEHNWIIEFILTKLSSSFEHRAEALRQASSGSSADPWYMQFVVWLGNYMYMLYRVC